MEGGSRGGRRTVWESQGKRSPALGSPGRPSTCSLTCAVAPGEVAGHRGAPFLRSRSSGFVRRLQFLSGLPQDREESERRDPIPTKSLDLVLWFLG